ncbi:pyruvate formate-lyase-activating protein [Desulfosediminicola sp.]|uniref:pyruvate formate-lyase-activating protein n=1 Tax=Desulfosediminicola sp. TaxID=2886825 RepID=UPI003AF204BB
MNGYIHSIETMALHDGPGIRFAVFFQGCGLRCIYCHNPDTWQFSKENMVSAEDLYAKTLRYRSYMEHSSGGVTCTGGEPLLQPEFLLNYLRLCRDGGLHTAIDTSGVGFGAYEEILKVTDLVLLDVKAVSADGFQQLTGVPMAKAEPFYRALANSGTSVRIRHVLVPGVNDSEENIEELQKFIQRFPAVEQVELLAYHTLGVSKYEHMKRPYPLEGVEPLSKERLKYFQSFFD